LASIYEVAKLAWNEFTNPRKKIEPDPKGDSLNLNLNLQVLNNSPNKKCGLPSLKFDRTTISDNNGDRVFGGEPNISKPGHTKARSLGRNRSRTDRIASPTKIDKSDLSVDKLSHSVIYPQILEPLAHRALAGNNGQANNSNISQIFIASSSFISSLDKKTWPSNNSPEKRSVSPFLDKHTRIIDDEEAEPIEEREEAEETDRKKLVSQITMPADIEKVVKIPTPYPKYPIKNILFPFPAPNLRLTPLENRIKKQLEVNTGGRSNSRERFLVLNDISLINDSFSKEFSESPIVENKQSPPPKHRKNSNLIMVKGLQYDFQRLQDERLKSLLSIGNESFSKSPEKRSLFKGPVLLKPHNFEIPFPFESRDQYKGFTRFNLKPKKGQE